MKRINNQLDSLESVFSKNNFSQQSKAKAFYDLAEKEEKNNRLSEALYYFKKATDFYDINDNKKELANIYIRISVIFKTQYDFENALENYFKAKQLLNEIKDFYKESKVTENIASIYINKGMIKTGLKYIQSAREFYLTNPKKYKSALLANSNNLGTVYYKLNKKDSSFIWFKMAYSHIDNTTNAMEVAVIYNNLGNIYYDKNILDSALYYYTETYNIIKNENNVVYLGVILENIGQVKVKEKKYDEALKYYEKAMNLLTKEKASEYLLNVYLDLIEFYKTQNNYKSAIEYSEKYRKLKDSCASFDQLNKFTEIEKSFDIRNRENKISLMEKEKELILKKSKIKTIWQYILFSGLFILFLVSFLIFRNLKGVIKNKVLKEKLLHQEKLQFETELNIKNAELEIRKKDIEIKNKDIEFIALRIVEKNEFIAEIEKQIDALEGTEKDKQKLLKITNSIRNNIAIEKEMYEVQNKINEAYEGFFQKLALKHPNLSKTDKRFCSLMVLNLETKEIASLLNITIFGVKKARFRLRKKLNLNSEDDISNYLKSL
ncbi:MAG: tetratricopeptide repeat protein [Bacteroidales bacterium]|nr:tetratricopeptide repeat protein [Bacteroidales bacterium]